MLDAAEVRVRVERLDAVRVGGVAGRPFGAQDGFAAAVVVVPQESGVDLVVRAHQGQHPLTGLRRCRGIDGHQLGRDRRDEIVEAAPVGAGGHQVVTAAAAGSPDPVSAAIFCSSETKEDTWWASARVAKVRRSHHIILV